MVMQEIARLLVAAVLGGIIGFERERGDRAAGLRTHALVCTASALIMIVSAYGFADVITASRTIVLDPSRVAAQVVSGVGFLGAGTIILRKNAVRGLTTAASIWLVAGIGLACGSGLYVPAGATTVIALVILSGLKPIEQHFFDHKRVTIMTIAVRRQAGQVAAIEDSVRACGLELQRLNLEPSRTGDNGTITLELRGGRPTALPALVEGLREVPGVKAVSYRRRDLVFGDEEQGEGDEDSA
jgi:putative Mg2+ transporter-C (MgtC) family protein